jgi:Secretion system C-terminal sorting domain
MKRFTTLFVTAVIIMAMVSAPGMAENNKIYYVAGAVSDTPVDWGVDPVYAERYNELDVEFINFDANLEPCLFNDQVPLTNEYAGQGVIFSGAGEVLDECSNFGISNYSSPNFLAFNTGIPAPGPETMSFSPAISSLSLWAGSANAATITLNAYNAANILVDQDVILATDALQQMSVSGAGIVTAVISFTGTWMCVDDLAFDEADQSPCVLSLNPQNNSVPAGGGNITFVATLTNNTPNIMTGAAWIQAQYMPTGNTVQTNYFPGLAIPPNATVSATLSVFVPGIAPGGPYMMQAYFGQYPWSPMCWGSFDWVKNGPAADNFEVFEHPELWMIPGSFAGVASFGEEVLDAAVPNEFEMGSAYPNPFNPSTTFSVILPESAELTVAVFNVAGQQVATIASGQLNAGSHSLTFDASDLSGGVYFVQASASGWSAVQKVVLMK